MNILITGATGFVGQNLVRNLIANNHNVCAFIRPNSNTKSLSNINVRSITIPERSSDIEIILRNNNFDGIIHLATFYTAEHTTEDVNNLIEANISFGTKLLDAATRANITWFINTETFTQFIDEDIYSPANLYSATKQAFHDVTRYYSDAKKINILTLVLFNTFGAGDTRKKIFSLWKSSMDSKAPVDMSPGEQIIDITHIDNIIEGYNRALEILGKDKGLKLNGKVFTLPSPERMTLCELSKLFSDEIGKDLVINFGATPYRQNEIMNPIIGTALPGWQPKISLREGIRKTFNK